MIPRIKEFTMSDDPSTGVRISSSHYKDEKATIITALYVEWRSGGMLT